MRREWSNPRILRDRPLTRVWVGELPALRYEPASVLRWQTAARGAIGEERQAAVEWFRPSNAEHYGLLGGRFSPGTVEGLQVEVAASSTDDERPWPLAEPPTAPAGQTLVGLPLVFAEVVLDAVQHTDELALLGPGTLRFDHAAHNDMMSTEIDFRQLARAAVRLLTRASPSSPEAELLPLLRRDW